MIDLTWGLLHWDRDTADLEFQVNIVKFKDYKIYKNKIKDFIYKKLYVQRLWDHKMFMQKLN